MFIYSEYVEGVVPISSHREGDPPQHGSKNLRKDSRSLRDRERNYLNHNSNKFFPQNAHSTRVHFDQKSDQTRVHDDQKNDQTRVYDDQKNDHSEHLSTYNNLLKALR